MIAHVELQTIIGQVMDTFRDRLYGLSSASDEMPSPVVMKVESLPPSSAFIFVDTDLIRCELLAVQLENGRMENEMVPDAGRADCEQPPFLLL